MLCVSWIRLYPLQRSHWISICCPPAILLIKVRKVKHNKKPFWWPQWKDINCELAKKNFNRLILHFERKQAIYSMINDICISIRGHQGRIISKGKNMMRTAKKETKMTRFPAPGIEPWPRTATWCGQMLYPLSCGELVNINGWILKSSFRCPTHCKDQAKKHMPSSMRRKQSPLQWFATESISIRWTLAAQLLRLLFLFPFPLFFFIKGVSMGFTDSPKTASNMAVRSKKLQLLTVSCKKCQTKKIFLVTKVQRY